MVERVTFYARSKRVVYVWPTGRRVELVVQDEVFYSMRQSWATRPGFDVKVRNCGNILTFTRAGSA